MSVCAAQPLGWTLKVSKGVFLLCFSLLELPELAEGWKTSHVASLASSLADNVGRCEEAAEEAPLSSSSSSSSPLMERKHPAPVLFAFFYWCSAALVCQSLTSPPAAPSHRPGARPHPVPVSFSPHCPQQEWERDLLRQLLPAWIPAARSPVLLLLLARVLEAEEGMGEDEEGGEEPAVVLMGEP